MDNFVNNNYVPDVTFFNQLPDPSQNEAFNKATHPSEKPIITKHIFAIDSRQRNYETYPHANNYNIAIPERYRNVTSIELKAAMLPRTEYNVHSSNKYLDFVVGDYIHTVTVRGSPIVTYNTGLKVNKVEPGTYKIGGSGGTDYSGTISVPGLSPVPWSITEPIEKIYSLYPGSVTAPEIEITVNINSEISNIAMNDMGEGYSHSNPPIITFGNFKDFKVTVGKEYLAELREGQYVVGGNPQFIYNGTEEIETTDSYTPNDLMKEIESAMSYAILKDATGFTGTTTAEEYCYGRNSWVKYRKPRTDLDYPLLFTSRIMSQYPDLKTYKNPTSSRTDINEFETNACKYNRIYNTNCLIVKSRNPSSGTFLDGGITYQVLKSDTISRGLNTEYIYYLGWDLNTGSPPGTGPAWPISGAWGGISRGFAYWEFIFASGQNSIINSASLLGYNKKNYNYNHFTQNDNILVNYQTPAAANADRILVPRGITYSSENDYYMFADPEYIILSFRPKYGGNPITGINNRVDSQETSNINRVFACLIFDTNQPAVLQDVSSGTLQVPAKSVGSTNNQDFKSFILNNAEEYNTPNLQENDLLCGNTGIQNVSYNKLPGQMKAMKGADFDRKIVEFYQPVAQIYHMNIRFSKFTKLYGQGTPSELYDFHGKEHLLLFEITCSDLRTGNRF